MTKILVTSQGKALIGSENKAYSYNSGENPVADGNDVNFIDYDGTIRYSYSAAEFTNLSALPANPTQSGLTAQGWNWSLADAKAYVAKYRILDIGQMYITDDGKTRLYLHIPEEGTETFTMNFKCYAGNGGTVDIDWGDGSAHTIIAGTSSTQNVNPTHAYSKGGDIVITIAISSEFTYGCSFYSNSPYYIFKTSAGEYYPLQMGLYKVEMGYKMRLEEYAFRDTAVETITMPQPSEAGLSYTLQNMSYTDYFASSSLKAFVIPSEITSVQNKAFENARELKRVSVPKGVEFYSIYNNKLVFTANRLQRIVIPESATILPYQFCHQCYSLSVIVLPDTITELKSSTFYNCVGLRKLYAYPSTPPTISTDSFYGMPTDCIIYVPNGSLSAYQTATNWSTYSSKMVEMPA